MSLLVSKAHMQRANVGAVRNSLHADAGRVGARTSKKSKKNGAEISACPCAARATAFGVGWAAGGRQKRANRVARKKAKGMGTCLIVLKQL